METWKIGVIVALLLSLVGFGIYQQNSTDHPLPAPEATLGGTSKPLPYVGKTLPAWNFTQWSGTAKPISLSSLQGKTALLEIFRIGCSHCQEAAPFMVALQNRYGPRGLKIIAIQSPALFKDPENPENQWKDVQSWVKEKNINYPVAMDAQSAYFQGKLAKTFYGGKTSTLSYPTTMLLDKTGKVVEAHSGFAPSLPSSLAKIIYLTVEIEKRFPGSPESEKNGADLVKWLKIQLPALQSDAAMSKALRDDIAQRLK